MLQEPFSTGNSQIHRLDPRFKMVLATVYAFVVALSNNFPALIAALIFSFALVGVCRLDLIWLVVMTIAVIGVEILEWVKIA